MIISKIKKCLKSTTILNTKVNEDVTTNNNSCNVPFHPGKLLKSINQEDNSTYFSVPIHFQSVYVPSTDICPVLASHKNTKWIKCSKKGINKDNDSSQSLNSSHHTTNFNGDKKFTFLGYLIIKPIIYSRSP